jgi:type I restriction enzyme S subunit
MAENRKQIGELLEAVPRQPKIKRSAYQDRGLFPIVDQSQAAIAGYTDDEAWLYTGKLPVVVFGDHTRILKFVDFPFCVGADGTQLLRPVSGTDIRYLYYALKNVDLQNYGYERHFKYLKEESINVPACKDQQRIADVLSSYDELIENNQRRIKILESMTRALYREWFVNFRFPGNENHPSVTSPFGEIPQGWEVKTVKEILARRPAGSVYRDADVKPEGDIPVIDQSTSELLGFHDNEPDHQASSALPVAIFGDHTCKMQLLIEPFSVGPNVVPFAASHEMPTSYVFFAVNSLVHTQEYKRHWIPLTAKEVIVADRQTAERFASLIQPMLVIQETHRKATRNLRRTRDLLLPRLLSGQIDMEAIAS